MMRDRFLAVPPSILLEIAKHLHPYEVTETLPLINRSWRIVIANAPVSFAKENLNHGIPTPFHLEALDWNRVLPMHIAASLVSYGFRTSEIFEGTGIDSYWLDPQENKDLLRRSIPVFEKYDAHAFVKFRKDAVRFFAHINAAQILRRLLHCFLKEESSKLPVSAVNVLLKSAMRTALKSESHDVLKMLLDLPNDELEVDFCRFRSGLVFPDPTAAFAMCGWMWKPTWDTVQVLLSHPRGNTLEFRRMVTSRVDLGISLVPFLKDFCSPDDDLGELKTLTIGTEEWKQFSTELLQALNDNRIKFGRSVYSKILDTAFQTDCIQLMHKIVEVAARRGVDIFAFNDEELWDPFTDDDERWDQDPDSYWNPLRIACLSNTDIALRFLLNSPQLQASTRLLTHTAFRGCLPTHVATVLTHPGFSLEQRPDDVLSIAAVAAFEGNVTAIQILHEKFGLEMAHFQSSEECSWYNPSTHVVFKLTGRSRCSHVSFASLWELAFTDSKFMKLLLPLYTEFDALRNQIDMELEDEEFFIHIHAAMDCSAEARRISLKHALNQEWPRLIKFLITVMPTAELPGMISFLFKCKKETVDVLLSNISPTAWKELIDLPRFYCEASVRSYEQGIPSDKLYTTFAYLIQILLHHPNTHDCVNFDFIDTLPAGRVPHPAAVGVLLTLSKKKGQPEGDIHFDPVTHGATLLRRMCLDEDTVDGKDNMLRAEVVLILLDIGEVDPVTMVDGPALVAKAYQMERLEVLSVLLEDMRMMKHYGLA
ncbi:hypothetical protein HDU96_005960 [Phlyctochytrium bullatum]|nr:hypothetical protein HDU96_005960 [Phlyctochytrium bullatum]